MNHNITKTIAVACGVALTVSTLAGISFARGGSGGHSSSGMSQSSGRSMQPSSNFSRNTPSNFNSVNRTNNFTKTNSNSHNGNFKNGFVSNKFQKMTMQKFSKSKSQAWKKYCGWGKFYGPWGWDFGWGWGCWDSPWCYGWCWYEPVAVVAYYNPYCDCAGTVVDGIDYSAPIAKMPQNTVNGDDSDAFAAAREAFAQGDLDVALKTISLAALQSPQNQDIHQFHSLVLFAKGEYCKSATVAHVVLEAGPGWTWNTLQAFYPSPEIYTEQLRRLEHFANEHTSDANVRFLLGYHYLMLNYTDSAQRQLTQLVDIEPRDRLAASILGGINTATAAKNDTVKNDTAKIETVKIETVKNNTLKNDTVRIDAVRNDAPKTNTSKIDTSDADNSETDTPPEIDTAKTATVKTDTVKTDTVKLDTSKTETVKRETNKTDNLKNATVEAYEESAVAQPSQNLKPVADEKVGAVVQVPPVPAAPTTPADSLTGTWKANPTKDVQIEVTLRADKTFTWKFTAQSKAQSFTGKYQADDKSLALTRADGESMEGTLQRDGNSAFKFRMKDAESDDPGLSFSR
jgi:hypothetical protein